MKKRIKGIDVARALAIIGMIIVNFKIVFGQEGSEGVQSIAGIFDGKAAATFVVLAGIGLALMTNSAIQKNDRTKLKTARNRIVKRALFLFLVGLSYLPIWPADILHFYGIYMLFILLLLTQKENVILASSIGLILLYPLMMVVFDYEKGWNFDTFEYHGFLTFNGFFRNLFFNGFHPVIPWTSFMLFGYWFGKKDLRNPAFIKMSLWMGLVIFFIIQILSKLSISILSSGDPKQVEELGFVLGTSPMPPLPFYMISGISISVVIISTCVLLAERLENNLIIDALYKTGQLALTFYVAHVIIGMGFIEWISPEKMGSSSIEFSLIYAMIFTLLCVFFAVIWRKYKKAGPLEWVMRKLTG